MRCARARPSPISISRARPKGCASFEKSSGETPAETLASTYQIEVAGRLVGAEASLKPLYDPSGLRIAG